MPFNLSIGEIVVLLVVAVILFGGRLPEVARTIAMTVGNIKRGMSAEMGKLDRDLREAVDVRPAPRAQPAAPAAQPTGPVPGQECEEALDEGSDPEPPPAPAVEVEKEEDPKDSAAPEKPATPPESPPPSPTQT